MVSTTSEAKAPVAGGRSLVSTPESAPEAGDTPRTGRSTRGAALLGGRQLLSLVMSLLSATLLSRWLEAADYGLFGTLNMVVFGAAIVLGDLGLSVALVRQEHEPPAAQWAGAVRLTTTLSLTSLVVGAVATAMLVAAGDARLGLWVAVLVAAVASRFTRAVPSARLQRDLRFSRLAVFELVETTLYFGIVLSLAWAGAGAAAFVFAVGAKEIVGAGLLRLAAGRPVRSDVREYRQLLGIGMPVQGAGVLIALTDFFQPLFIGLVLGQVVLGHVVWAYNLILMPILLLGAVDRVVLPSLARAQEDRTLMGGLAERAIRLNCLVALPVVAAVLVAPTMLVEVVFSPRWVPSVELLVLFAPAIITTAMTAPVLQAFNAVGRTRVAMWLSASWLVTTWTIGAYVTNRWGATGFGWFYVGLQLAYVPVWVVAQRSLGVRVVRSSFPALTGLGAAVLAGRAVVHLVATPVFTTLALALTTAVLVFIATVAALAPATLRADLLFLADGLVPGASTRLTARERSASESPRWRLGYVASFDGLRGIAVVAVLAHHAHVPYLAGGFLGVDLFFVLSGFLITALLVQERDRTGSVDYRRFYARRALRLFPALLAAGVAIAAYTLLAAPPELKSDTLFGLPFAVTYLSNYVAMVVERGLGVVNHTWSLAIEEQFYLFWPPLLLVMVRRFSRSGVVAITSVVVVVVALARAIVWARTGDLDLVYYPLHARADALLIGCIGALILTAMSVEQVQLLGRRLLVPAAVATAVFGGIALVATTTSGWVYLGGLSVVALACLIVIAWLVATPDGRCSQLLGNRALRFFGTISYGLYLWHFPIFEGVKAHAPNLPFRYLVPVQMGISFIVAVLSYVLVERVFLRMKSRFAVATS